MNLRQWARTTHRVLAEQREEGGAVLSGEMVEQVLRVAINTLIDELADGGELRIDALGRVWVEERAARRVVSNLAGKQQVYVVENRRVVRFRVSRRLAASLDARRTGEELELVRELEMTKKSREQEEDRLYRC